eukprot:620799-Rhodomonas_salina.2
MASRPLVFQAASDVCSPCVLFLGSSVSLYEKRCNKIAEQRSAAMLDCPCLALQPPTISLQHRRRVRRFQCPESLPVDYDDDDDTRARSDQDRGGYAMAACCSRSLLACALLSSRASFFSFSLYCNHPTHGFSVGLPESLVKSPKTRQDHHSKHGHAGIWVCNLPRPDHGDGIDQFSLPVRMQQLTNLFRSINSASLTVRFFADKCPDGESFPLHSHRRHIESRSQRNWIWKAGF